MGTRAAWVRAAAVAGAVVAGAGTGGAACSPGGGPPQRGFGSVQLQAIRDPTLDTLGQWSTNQIAYSVTDASGAQSFFFLDVTNGQVTSVGNKLPTPDGGGTVVGNPLSCEIDIDGTQHVTETITDSRTGQQTVIDGANSVWPTSCPTPDNPNLLVWTRDDAGHFTLSEGPYTALAPVPVDVIVLGIVTFDPDASVFTVVAAEPATPDALGLYRVDPAVGASVPVVAPALGDAAWAAGAPPAAAGGSLASTTLAYGPSPAPVGDHFVYGRTMSDGSTVMFAGPFAGSPAELALFPAEASLEQLSLPAAVPATGFGAAWAAASSGAVGSVRGVADDVLRAWYPAQRRLVTCNVPPANGLTISWQPGPDRLVIDEEVSYSGSIITGPLLLMSAGDTPCTLLASQGVYDVELAPDNTALAWLVAPTPLGDRELWTAGADGSAPRKLGTGGIDWATFTSNRELELALGGDLAWLTLDDDPARLHYIAEGVFGQIAAPVGDGSWWLVGYDFSEQDSTGTLGLVQHDTGDKRLISGSVAWHQLMFRPPSDPAAGDTRVVYLVRGRNPSPQDGIWMATIKSDELP
jgi:hypothetical protein